MSIKLSPKHGFNLFMPGCFWCGKEKEIIALPGKVNRNDDEMKNGMVVDIEPCDKCKTLFDSVKNQGGILILEVSDDPEKDLGKERGEYVRTVNTMSGRTEMFLTGSYAGIREQAFNDIFRNDNSNEICDNVIAGERAMYLDHEIYQEVFGNIQKEMEESQ